LHLVAEQPDDVRGSRVGKAVSASASPTSPSTRNARNAIRRAPNRRRASSRTSGSARRAKALGSTAGFARRLGDPELASGGGSGTRGDQRFGLAASARSSASIGLSASRNRGPANGAALPPARRSS
jgi:hypothetical protein